MAQGAVSFRGTAEGLAGPHPAVFVVDTQASSNPGPSRRRLGGGDRRALHCLVALTLVGMLVEAGCIMHLYNRTQVLMNAAQHTPVQQNGGTAQGLTGFKETNEIPVEPERRPRPPEQKPAAHLRGSNSHASMDNKVQWLDNQGLSVLKHGMNLTTNGSLVVLKEGYYYVYSKVQFAEDCSLFKHQVMRKTDSYITPLVLMKADRYHCLPAKSKQQEHASQNVMNSYLGGVFHLSAGDRLYVTVENRTLLKLGSEQNFMGAFMI